MAKTGAVGMIGPNGPLPIHFTESIQEARNTRQDHTMGDFLNLFQHRSLTHFFRAWADAQSVHGLDRPTDERFTRYIAWLGGDEPELAEGLALPPHARWASISHRIRPARNPEGLVETLQHFFGIPFELQEFRLHWIELQADEQNHLGVMRLSSVLGQGAVLGELVPDRQNSFRLVIGPMDLSRYLRFTPQASRKDSDLEVLVDYVRAFVGYEYVWEVQLLIISGHAPSASLGGGEGLAWSTWLGGGGGVSNRWFNCWYDI